MARTIRVKLYKFSELSEKAKQKAIEWGRDLNVDYDWSELSIEGHEERLAKQGFIEPKVMFSGFGSQGDGACFICSSIDFRIFLSGKYKDFASEISANITHSWRYYFATSTNVDLNIDTDGLADDDYKEIFKAIQDERERLGNDIYRKLEKEYDWRTSDEQVIETIEANEYEFLKDGTKY